MSPIVLSPQVVEALQVVVLVTGLGGAVLNARGRVESFYCWTVSNLAMLLLMLQATYQTGALLYVCYVAINIYGIYFWRRKAPVGTAQ
jgi:nicotinamide riboside transporter PnuC